MWQAELKGVRACISLISRYTCASTRPANDLKPCLFAVKKCCQQVNFVRFVNVLKEIEDDEQQVNQETQINPITVARFCEVLDRSEEEIIKMLEKNSRIRKLKRVNLVSKLNNLTEWGITVDMILQHPWLLSESKETLDMKLELLRDHTKAKLPSTICLLKMSVTKLYEFLDKNKVTPREGQRFERISFLTDTMQCDEKRACDLLQKHKFLLTLPFERMKEMINLLEEAGVQRADILKDPYILCYNLDAIKPRLQEAHSFGMTKIKPWLARSKQEIFYRSLERYRAIKEQMGSDPTMVEFLMRRLNLDSPDEVMEMYRIQPRLAYCTARKLGNAITALEKEGYTCEQIVECPRVLAASIKTVLGRLKLLRELKPNSVPSLKVLAFSNQNFNKYLSRIKNT